MKGLTRGHRSRFQTCGMCVLVKVLRVCNLLFIYRIIKDMEVYFVVKMWPGVGG